MKKLSLGSIFLAIISVSWVAEIEAFDTLTQGIERLNPSKDDFINGLKPSQKKPRTRGLALVPGNAAKQSRQKPAAVVKDDALSDESMEAGRATPPASVAVSAPQISVNLTFGFNSAKLTNATRATLDNLGSAMQDQQLKPYHFMIEGHTDSIGGAAYNWELSLRRAAAVKRYLIEKHQVNPARMKVAGKGEAEPAYPDNPEAPGNRRVVIINTGAD